MLKKIITFLIIAAVIVAAVILVKKRKQAISEAPTAKVMLTSVNAYKPSIQKVLESETFLATLQSINQPQISSKSSGYITKIYVQESQNVRKGDLLVEIDDEEIRSGIEGLKANLRVAKQDLAQSQKNLQRTKALFNIGGISKESYEMAALSVQSKKATLVNITENINAKENLLTYTKIHAPIDGTIGTIFIKEGSLAAVGKPIMEIVGDQKRLIFSYTPNRVISVGQDVLVNGEIEKISTIYDVSNGALMRAEIALTQPLNLPNGASVEIQVVLKRDEGLAIPVNALLHEDAVYVMVYKDGHFSKQKVDIVAVNDTFAITSPQIKDPVAIGSESKLSKLPVLQNIKVVLDEK